jgi:hypothetical protein
MESPFWMKRGKGESASGFRRRRALAVSLLGKVIDVESGDNPSRTVGEYDPISGKWAGCRAKFEDNKPVYVNGKQVWIIECSTCHYLFETTNARRLYCSGACKRVAYIEQQRKRQPPKPKEPRCLNCGGLLTDKRRGTKFCGNKCSKTWHRKN